MIDNSFVRGVLREEAGNEDKAPAFDPVAFKKEMQDEVNKGINALGKQIKQLTALIPKPPEPKDDSKGEQDQKDQSDIKESQKETAALRRLTADLALVQKELATAKTERLEVEARVKTERLNNALKDGLIAGGVDKDRLTHAIRSYKDEVRYSEDGKIIAGIEDEPLADFLARELKPSGAGGIFLPPQKLDGSGAGNGKSSSGKTVDFQTLNSNSSADDIANVTRQISEILAAG